MADRTSACLFGMIFDKLAENPTESNKQLAMEFASMMKGYDFSPCQMDSEDSCLKLGIAVEGVDPEDGEVVLYVGERGFKKALKKALKKNNFN